MIVLKYIKPDYFSVSQPRQHSFLLNESNISINLPDCSAHYIEIKSVSVLLNKYSFVVTLEAGMNNRCLASFIGGECGLNFPPYNVTVVWPNLNLQLNKLVNLDRTFEVSVISLFDLIWWKYHQEVNLISVIFIFSIRLLYHVMFSTWNNCGGDQVIWWSI